MLSTPRIPAALGLIWLCATFTGCEPTQQMPGDEPPISNTIERATSTPTQPDKPTQPAKLVVAGQGEAIFDLVDNRHLAHFHDGGLVIPFGVGAGLKYVQGRWKNPWFDGSKDGESQVAYPGGIGATVRFPLGALSTGKTDDAWSVQARLKPAGEQRCDVFLNAPGQSEQKIGSLVLDEGWKTYDIKLPPGLELGQEHTLRFHFSRSRDVPGVGKSAAAFDWVRVGKGLKDAAPATQASRFDAMAKTITLAPNQSLTYYTTLAADTSLTAHVDGKLGLEISEDGGSPERATLEGKAATHALSKWGGKAVRLTLRNTGSAPVTITAPALTVARQKVTPLAAGPKYVVVWLVDTLRADHMKAYNPQTDVTTPNLDRFIADAALFERASVQGNSSLPSSATIFSGAYPSSHGVVKESARQPKDFVLLGEAMKKAGFSNGLFSSNGYVSNKWGFARGFEKEFNPIREGGPSEAEYLWPKAAEWLGQKIKAAPEGKVFVYLNTSDPHVPYDPPAEDLGAYHSGPKVGKVSPRGTGELLHDMAKKGGPSLNASEQAYMRALYKGEISYNDRWFGKMLEDLEKLGIRDQTMIVVTSDHGEEFGEYGRWGHGVSVNQELVDVPLIVGYSPWTKGGVRVPHAVETLDIYPTLLEAAGVPATTLADNVQGTSLASLIQAPTLSHPTPSMAYHNDFLRSARVHDFKYQLYQGDKDPLHVISYHPTKYADYSKAAGIDGEDISTQRPILRRQMRDLMAFHLHSDERARQTKSGEANNHSTTRAAALDAGW